MADIPYIQQAQEVKITGQDSTGTTVNYVSADSNGNLSVANTNVDKTSTFAFTAINQNLDINCAGLSTIRFQVTGTWVGTFIFYVSTDGTNFDAAPSVWDANNPTNFLDTLAVNGSGLADVTGIKTFRINSSGWSSGTANLTAIGSAKQAILEQITGTMSFNGTVRLRDADDTPVILGQNTMANSLPVVIASNQTSIPVAATLSAETTKVIGTINVAATQTIATTNAGTFAVQAAQAGTWTVQPGNTANTTAWKVDGSAVTQPISGSLTNISGTISLPTNAATSANQTTEITSLQLIDNIIGPVAAGTAATNSALIGGQFNTALPTLTNTQQSAIQLDSSGRSIISPLTNTSIIKVQLQDNTGAGITSTTDTTKQALDVNIIRSALNYYSAPVNIRQSAATAAGGTVWTMRNPAASTKTVYIEQITLMMAFDSGTPLTRSLLRYDLERFTTATPTTGTAITVVLMDSSNAATSVTDVRFLDTGLTTTSVVFGTPFVTLTCPATDATTTIYRRENIAFKLAAGEGLAIRLNVAAVVGQSLGGEIVWSER